MKKEELIEYEDLPTEGLSFKKCHRSGRGQLPPNSSQESYGILTDKEREENPHAYNAWPANWVTPVGVWKKKREIEAKGLPDTTGCKMLTLTSNQTGCSPQECYERGSIHIRRFLVKLKKILGVNKLRYIWKLELHRNGHPHWHLVLLYRGRIPYQTVYEAWGLGRVHVRDMTHDGLKYLFKPAFLYEKRLKSQSWILDYCAANGEGKRPRSSIRFWQSRNFYTGERPTEETKNREQKTSRIPLTLRARIEIWRRRMILVWPTPRGRRFRVFELLVPFRNLICELLAAKAQAATGAATEIPKISIAEISPYLPTYKCKTLNEISQCHSFEEIIASP